MVLCFCHKLCVAIVPTVESELLLKFIDPQQSESGVSLNETPNLPFDEPRPTGVRH